MKQDSNLLPKTISDRYELYKQEKLWGQSSSKKGLYIDKKTDTLVFIKINTNGKSLFREYEYQRLFYEQSKKLKTTNIVIPKPLKILKVDNYVALVMEYLPAKSLLKVDVETRLDVYMKVLKFLEKVNTMNDFSKKNGLIQKPSTVHLMTLPYFLSRNLLIYFPYASLFLHSAGLITGVAPQWLKLTSNWMCHGDINVTNILLYKKKIVILDFAYALRSHRYFDISRALNSTWYQKGFHQQLWKRILSEFRFTVHQKDLLKSFVIFNLMQRLSQRYTDVNQELFYLRRLEELTSS
ncbi:phosphotransferase [Candidatus Gottesmanbacteria bacterium]|nr:phosphotransferase [Candidatus Gottesmanbacteria bacterium]